MPLCVPATIPKAPMDLCVAGRRLTYVAVQIATKDEDILLLHFGRDVCQFCKEGILYCSGQASLWCIDGHYSQGALSYQEFDCDDPAAHSVHCNDMLVPFFLDHDANCARARLISNVVQFVPGDITHNVSGTLLV